MTVQMQYADGAKRGWRIPDAADEDDARRRAIRMSIDHGHRMGWVTEVTR